ncbi:MAG: JAB-like toxin 1 domain-containing protein [Bacteroidales bacterium]|nr:JAB-like toxin 1 domain-containing protein [Bacteroidales bacterium]
MNLIIFYRTIVIKNEKGEKIYSQSYERGTITKLNSNGNAFGVKGDNNGKELFQFLADNTGDEWSHVQTGEGGENGKNYLFTSFEEDHVKTSLSVLEGKIRVFNHNHPNGSSTASPEDKQSLLDAQFYNLWCEGRFPNKGSNEGIPEANIYIGNKKYIPFDPKTKALYENLKPIQINIKP